MSCGVKCYDRISLDRFFEWILLRCSFEIVLFGNSGLNSKLIIIIFDKTVGFEIIIEIVIKVSIKVIRITIEIITNRITIESDISEIIISNIGPKLIIILIISE